MPSLYRRGAWTPTVTPLLCTFRGDNRQRQPPRVENSHGRHATRQSFARQPLLWYRTLCPSASPCRAYLLCETKTLPTSCRGRPLEFKRLFCRDCRGHFQEIFRNVPNSPAENNQDFYRYAPPPHRNPVHQKHTAGLSP